MHDKGVVLSTRLTLQFSAVVRYFCFRLHIFGCQTMQQVNQGLAQSSRGNKLFFGDFSSSFLGRHIVQAEGVATVLHLDLVWEE